MVASIPDHSAIVNGSFMIIQPSSMVALAPFQPITRFMTRAGRTIKGGRRQLGRCRLCCDGGHIQSKHGVASFLVSKMSTSTRSSCITTYACTLLFQLRCKLSLSGRMHASTVAQAYHFHFLYRETSAHHIEL